jgi:hypothetical protein
MVLACPGFTENKDRGFRRRHQVYLADDLSQGGALPDKVAEGFGFHHLLLQIGRVIPHSKKPSGNANSPK